MIRLPSFFPSACAASLLMLAASTAQAELIFYDSFDDAPGAFPPSGWNTLEADFAAVSAGTLDYPNLFTSSNKLEFTGVDGEFSVSYTDTPLGAGESIFFSYLIQVHDVGELGSGATATPIVFRAEGAAAHEGVAGLGFGRLDTDAENEYRLSIDGDFRGFGRTAQSIRIDQTFTEGETVLIVGSYAYDDGMANFWINPDSATFGDVAAPSAHFSDDGNTRALSLLHIIDGSQARFDHWSFDELRVGTTWADVTPVPEPSTYALLAGCGVIAFAIARRRQWQG